MLHLLLALGAAPAPFATPTAPPQQAEDRETQAETPAERVRRGELAAASGPHGVGFDELDALLVSRYALAPDGERATVFLAKTIVLDQLLAESRMEITRQELIERFGELDASVRAGGGAGLKAELASQGVDLEVFLETLRLGMAQERLARRALGLPEDQPVDPDSQELWLNQILGERGIERLPPPYTDDVVARVGERGITSSELGRALRAQLPATEIHEALEQLVLERALFDRLGPFDAAELEAQLDREIDRRRREAESDPAYSGVPFEDLLVASGRTIQGLRDDPALRVRARVELHLDEEASGDALRERYLAEKGRFDDLYGEAVAARWIYRVGRNREELDVASRELATLAGRATTEHHFAALALEHSQHAESAEFGGNIGDIHRAGSGLDPALVDALFQAARSSSRGVLGPIEISGGVVLLWAGDLRPTPPEDQLLLEVRGELARRLLRSALPEPAVTFVDPVLSQG